jgi:hypothetical protein
MLACQHFLLMSAGLLKQIQCLCFSDLQIFWLDPIGINTEYENGDIYI